MTRALLTSLAQFAELVKFSHTVFLLPFACAAVVLAGGRARLEGRVLWWTLVALVAARSAAMVMNRIADRELDALNPRTAGRPLVTGRVSLGRAWGWLVGWSLVFLLAAGMLNRLCLYLAPAALAWVLAYSFTKRFTALCHLWLGVATALAPVGAWCAVTGSWELRVVGLGVAVALWVAGFDVIYACQDMAFDRAQGLHSLPARLGLGRALWLSRLMHAAAVAGFWALGPWFGLGELYRGGVVVLGVVLAAEQVLVARRRANIPLAFFTLNGVVSILFLALVLADRLGEGWA